MALIPARLARTATAAMAAMRPAALAKAPTPQLQATGRRLLAAAAGAARAQTRAASSSASGATMRALVKRESKRGLWLEEVPRPSIGPGEVLVGIRSTSICGTDVHIYSWDKWAQKTVPVPMVVGHEWAGRILEIGDGVVGLKVGDRVTGEGHITCGMCRNCRAGRRHLCRNTRGIGVNMPGAFAEELVMPAINVFKLPDSIPDDLASFMDPLGNAVHTALSYDLIGEDVLITGAGPIGCMAAAICKHVGSRHVVITDANEYRLALARQCGADIAINVATDPDGSVGALRRSMRQLGMTEGFDIGLEMSGNKAAMADMLSTINNGGRIAMLGIPSEPFAINWDELVFKGITIKGIYGREMFETWYKMTTMLTSGLDKAIAPVLTHHFKAQDYEQAFDTMISGNSGKVVLHWD